MPTSLLIERIFRQWSANIPDYTGLPNAGKWIGYIERILIVTFVATHNFSAVGFLITAKSVFRFSDIKNSSDFRLTEYVLLGTLFSFAIAIIGGLLLLLWNDNVDSLWIWNNFTNIKFTDIKFRTSRASLLKTSGCVIPKTDYLKNLIDSLFYGNYLRKTSCLLSKVLYNVSCHCILLASNET